MAELITYDIFKDDPVESPLWVEAVEGLEAAMNRMEELAARDPTHDFYLFCAPAGKIVRRLRRKSARPDENRGEAPRRKAV
ncbi:MAG: hypothetical protein ACRD59_05350 [Candidatus Acidiferrales bacterium]